VSSASTSAIEIGRGAQPSFFATLRAALPDFWALTKPEVNLLIVVATFTGFYLGRSDYSHPFPFERLIHALFGTLLVASGAGALNQYFEYRFDARMRRTSRRPVAAARLSPAAALWLGTLLAVFGVAYLFLFVNALASILAVLTLTGYLFIYTPLKRKSPLCIVAGAFAGAMPPLIGWAAASDSIANAKAWTLYAVLFLWQFPHFMAIAWMYRDDYARAGYFVLPATHESAFLTRFTALPSIALLIASFAMIGGGSHIFQYTATAALGGWLLYHVARLVTVRSKAAARELLKVTIVYLLLLMVVLAIARA
jgi:protoheme IX farnesyltransferase